MQILTTTCTSLVRELPLEETISMQALLMRVKYIHTLHAPLYNMEAEFVCITVDELVFSQNMPLLINNITMIGNGRLVCGWTH